MRERMDWDMTKVQNRQLLLVNDDGIGAEGLLVLAELAGNYGDVRIVAPDRQNSAVAHGVSINRPLRVTRVTPDRSLPALKGAWSVDSTPADCVRIGIDALLPARPDLILSGINYGYNVSTDILYSGTVCAAQEGLIQGIPSLALSTDKGADFSSVRRYFHEVMDRLLAAPFPKNAVWNVNFPGCPAADCRGIRWDCPIDADLDHLRDHYIPAAADGDSVLYRIEDRPVLSGAPGSDLEAIQAGYVTVSRVRNTLL